MIDSQPKYRKLDYNKNKKAQKITHTLAIFVDHGTMAHIPWSWSSLGGIKVSPRTTWIKRMNIYIFLRNFQYTKFIRFVSLSQNDLDSKHGTTRQI